MMKIYKLVATIYDHFYDIDRDGWIKEEKFFTTKEKALKWQEENKDFCYGFEDNKAKKEWQMPYFEIEEIEVE